MTELVLVNAHHGSGYSHAESPLRSAGLLDCGAALIAVWRVVVLVPHAKCGAAPHQSRRQFTV